MSLNLFITDEYQYLSPVTSPQTTTTRKQLKKKVNKKISTTLRPTTQGAFVSPATERPTERPKSRRVPQKKPFEKISKPEPNRTYRPIENYDYYDDSNEKVIGKYIDDAKVLLHGKGWYQRQVEDNPTL